MLGQSHLERLENTPIRSHLSQELNARYDHREYRVVGEPLALVGVGSKHGLLIPRAVLNINIKPNNQTKCYYSSLM